MWGKLIGLASGVSATTWLCVGAIAALLAWHWHAVYAAGHAGEARATAKLQPVIDTLRANLAETERGRDEAISANGTNMTTIATLKGAVAMCESGRLADQSAQAKAMAERAKAATVAQAGYAKARAALDELTAGRCKTWDAMPACGVVP